MARLLVPARAARRQSFESSENQERKTGGVGEGVGVGDGVAVGDGVVVVVAVVLVEVVDGEAVAPPPAPAGQARAFGYCAMTTTQATLFPFRRTATP